MKSAFSGAARLQRSQVNSSELRKLGPAINVSFQLLIERFKL